MTKNELLKLVSKVSMFSTLAPLVLTMDEIPIEELPQELREKMKAVKKDLDNFVEEFREYIENKGELPPPKGEWLQMQDLI